MPEKAVSITQTALYLMENAHQQMAQECRKKLILKASLKFMAEDIKSFVSAVPMLFGGEFGKQATTTVDQVKAMKKLNFPPEKKGFSGYHPRNYKSGCSQERLWKIPALSERRTPDGPVIQPPRTKQSRTRELDLSPNVVKKL